MATGFDNLIDFLLAEIALCGVQGAGSADFRRFIQKYYEESTKSDTSSFGAQHGSHLPGGRLGRSFYEKLWNWVTNHPDVRVWYQDRKHDFSLSQFEAAEIHETGSNESLPSLDDHQSISLDTDVPLRPSNPLIAMRANLRQRLHGEGRSLETLKKTNVSASITSPANISKLPPISNPDTAHITQGPKSMESSADIPSTSERSSSIQEATQEMNSDESETNRPMRNTQRGPRKIPKGIRVTEPIFDVLASSTTAPRLYASQNRIWQALTGHSIDLKKVPSMEFMLLSIIAARGPEGIAQPDLVRMSGQDKRSVPHRTDELARKGYIEKKPVQEGRMRTSLCVHKKYVKEGHFLRGTGNVEDVFRNRTFVLSGFVHVLYNLLKDVEVIPMKDLRTRLGVKVQHWNQRAVRGAIRRLDESGFIKRVRVRKKTATEDWLVCIKLLREPTDDDINNLKFRRQVAPDEPLEDTVDGDSDDDTFMRDIEVDMLNDVNIDDETGAEGTSRIPPQWTPDRHLANLTFDAVSLGETDGWDAGMVRDRTVGKFWKRPMESYITRLTDHWEKTQPLHLRHLALIRDTRITQEKKFIHYVYRTYDNFQKAVDAGDVSWEGVSKEAVKKTPADKRGRPKKNAFDATTLDQWGFSHLNPKDFLRQDGNSTLSECHSAINHGRRLYNQHWDNALTQEMGYIKPKGSAKRQTQVPSGPLPTTIFMTRKEYEKLHEGQPGRETSSTVGTLESTQDTSNSPSAGEARSSPIPPTTISGFLAPAPRSMIGGGAPLLTKEQRLALGLSSKGRLGIEVEKQIREHRKRTGDPTALPDIIFKDGNERTPSKSRVQPLMSKEERKAQGLPEKGRLGKEKEDQIRRERGLAVQRPKAKLARPKRDTKEPPLLTKEQRIARGLPPVGRLPNSLIEQLRQERAAATTLESAKTGQDVQANVTPFELEETVDDASKSSATSVPNTTVDIEAEPLQEPLSHPVDVDVQMNTGRSSNETADPQSASALSAPEKRKANGNIGHLVSSLKRLRTEPVDNDVHEQVVPPTLAGQSAEHPPSVFALTTTHLKDSVATSIENEPMDIRQAAVDRTRITVDLTQAQLVPITFDKGSRAQLISERYMNRTGPGIYVNPFAKRNVGRGRPRNALMATFKSSKLGDLDWFKPDPNAVTNGSKPLSSKRRQVVRKARPPTTSEADLPQQLSRNEAESPAIDHVVRREISVQEEEVTEAQDIGTAPSVSMISRFESDAHVEENIQPRAPEAEESSQAPALQDHARASEVGLRPSEQPYRIIPAGWNAINAPPRTKAATYRSPYTPTTDPDAESSPKGLVDMPTGTGSINGHADTSSVSTPMTGTPAPEVDRESFHPLEVRNVELERPKYGSSRPRKRAAFAARGVVLGKGNVWRMRTSIIREILDRCHGVFPLNGEISVPFFTLWEQRGPKNMTRPDRSTLINTINNMIDDPEHQMKKMSFHIPGKDGATMYERFIVAYKHLTPASPEVKELQRNMIKTYPKRYYPDEIRDLVTDEKQYRPEPLAPIDNTINIDNLYKAKSLDERIRAITRQRQREILEKRKKGEESRITQNEEVENAAPKQATGARPKRTRLASLNKRTQNYQGNSVLKRKVVPIHEESVERRHRPSSPAASDTSEETPLIWLRPRRHPPPPVTKTVDRDLSSSGTEATTNQEPAPQMTSGPQIEFEKNVLAISLMAPTVCFYPTNGTFATHLIDPNATSVLDFVVSQKPTPTSPRAGLTSTGKKRVRIAEQSAPNAHKRRRLTLRKLAPKLGNEHTGMPYDGSEESSSSEEDLVRPKQRRGKPPLSKELPLPTLLERLTGLTGDQNEPIYQPPIKRIHPRESRPWSIRKLTQRNKQAKSKNYPEILNPLDKFKKMFYTLVIASSMSGEDKGIDWSIVERVYDADKSFDLAMAKKLWTWVHASMSVQLAELTSTFQASFLEAYEHGIVSSIEDPLTYDWTSLVQWALRNCKYPDVSLPLHQNALDQFEIEEKGYEVLDRTSWYKDKLTSNSRTQRLLNYSFVARLHLPKKSAYSPEDKSLKARSWIRSNTATPQEQYSGKLAHDKMCVLGNSTLERAVTDFVDHGILRMRKIKRLLPGRNYNFTARFAQDYRRPFEMKDFMDSVKLKKDLDIAFAHEDSTKRAFSISRSATDGSVMAVLSLLGERRVKFVPRLPPINSDFNAPLPRLSVWGFCEGDYVHRAIDRQRLFWPIDVVPTPTYEFGNPLQPVPLATDHSQLENWSPLPAPPLPGKQESGALLPIWSTIDGQNITWPWWYRILNLVLQPLVFQPGVTAEEIFRLCPKYTTEIFEVELILQWLESVNAITKAEVGGYQVNGGFWAAFGDKLIDMEDDWFNEHVKRKKTNHVRQPWREKYNLRFSTLHKGALQQEKSDRDDLEDAEGRGANERRARQQILQNSQRQYRIARQTLDPPREEYASRQKGQRSADAVHKRVFSMYEEGADANEDAVMEDINDAEDVDAEGESDDDLYE